MRSVPAAEVSRRSLFARAAVAAGAGAGAPEGAWAAAVATTRWLSGKNPEGPAPAGETKGTRKDYGYLQCLSGCLSRCQRPTPGEKEKDRATCLAECRDECCFTYEQCSAP